MASDGNDLEIVFELHSRSKLRSGGADDKANIMGIVDTSNTCSSWLTFKSYLAQSIGVTEDISVAYVNDAGEEIPIESEQDFRAALKYSKNRASRGQRIVLKIDRRRKHRLDTMPLIARYGIRYIEPARDDETSPREDEASARDDDDVVPPAWFVKYMEQFREKLIEAVVDTVIELDNIKEKKKLKKIICGAAKARFDEAVAEDGPPKPAADARKKHRSDEAKPADVDDVSDGQTKPCRAFKSHRHDRKIERLLDAKLGKIDARSRRSFEKKSAAKHEKHHHHSARKSSISALKRSHTGTYKKIDPELLSVAEPAAEKPNGADKPNGTDKSVRWKDEKPASVNATPAMGAMALSDYVVSLCPKRGQIVTYKWQVMNTGLYSWNEETELRYTWGCSALVPLNKTIECPILKPGECGVIEVTLQAPDAVGFFESYWCFFHEGRRFGQYLNLNCIVSSSQRRFPADCPVEKIENPVTAAEEVAKLEAEVPVAAGPERAGPERILNYGDYLYDSDSDDISVISGTISGDSSEQDEYVVVRMPGEDGDGDRKKIIVDGVEVTTDRDRYPEINVAGKPGDRQEEQDETVKAEVVSPERDEPETRKDETEPPKDEPESRKDVPGPSEETSDPEIVKTQTATVSESEPVEEPKQNSMEPEQDAKTETDDDADVVESIIGRFNYIINNFNTLSGESIHRFLEYARSVLSAGKITDEKKRKIVEKQAQVLQNKLDVRSGLPRPTIPLSYPGHDFTDEHGYGGARWGGSGPGYQYGFACSGPHYSACSGSDGRRPTCQEEAFADGRYAQGPFMFSPPGFVFNFPFPPSPVGSVPPPTGFMSPPTGFVSPPTGFVPSPNGFVPPPPPAGTARAQPANTERTESPKAPQPPKPEKKSNGTDGRHFTFTSTGSGFESSSKPKHPSPPPPPPPSSNDTSSDRPTRYAYVFDETNGNPIPTAPADTESPAANVHIIPETLIEGAVNVASSAYNTAKNVFGMFRNAETSPTDPLSQFANSNWRYKPPRQPFDRDAEQQPRRSIHRCLEILKEMGFNNRALNIKLLRRYDNDLPTVISKLI